MARPLIADGRLSDCAASAQSKDTCVYTYVIRTRNATREPCPVAGSSEAGAGRAARMLSRETFKAVLDLGLCPKACLDNISELSRLGEVFRASWAVQVPPWAVSGL